MSEVTQYRSIAVSQYRQLRPSSGLEHTVITYSVRDANYLMNETTSGTRCPTLFDKWHWIFYMPCRTDMDGHSKAFDYPVMVHWEKVKVRADTIG